jgi:hypothetical protein
MSDQPNLSHPTPRYVADLQAVYGAPTQSGFGSAVFYERLDRAANLERIALKYYRYFVGELWERFGEAAWMTPWKQVYRREPGEPHQVVAEMRAISDSSTALLVPILLDEIENSEAAQQALSDVYDDTSVVDLNIYSLGDGAAISGLLVAGRRETGDSVFLVLLLD